MKIKSFLEKRLDYLPLIAVYGFLLSLPGGVIRLHNPYYLIIGVVTIPVWIILIMATLKIRKAKNQVAPSISPPLRGGDEGEGEGESK
jgi:hypothetical protein